MEQNANVKLRPKAILVETNWVVDIVAPAHLQNPAAQELLHQAESGLIQLYVPAICLTEAKETIPRRFAPRNRSNDFRKFIKWANRANRITPEDAHAAFRVLDQFDGLVANELKDVGNRLSLLLQSSGLQVFPLTEQMLKRQITVGAMADISLKPYDLAIFSAILVKAEELKKQGHDLIGFCELDSDLQPWTKQGESKPSLARLYRESHICVYPSFSLTTPT